jgi:hypothetical protein
MCTKFFKQVWDALNPEFTPKVIPEDKIFVTQTPRCPQCDKIINIIQDSELGCKCEPKS